MQRLGRLGVEADYCASGAKIIGRYLSKRASISGDGKIQPFKKPFRAWFAPQVADAKR